MHEGREYSQVQDWGRFAPLVYDDILREYYGREVSKETMEEFEELKAGDLVILVISYVKSAVDDKNPAELFKAAHFLAQMYKKMVREGEKDAKTPKTEENSP